MALTVALLSIKGGVGKTTTAVNLSGLAALSGLRTLVWDLDPQGGATFALGDPSPKRDATRAITRKRPRLNDAVTTTVTTGLDLIPADTSLRTLDLELADASRSKQRIGEALDSVADRYDVIFIDCAPGVSVANDSALRAADIYLSPIVPSSLATRAFEQLVAYIDETPKARGDLVGFLSMVDRRKRAHRDLADRLPRDDARVLQTAIPASVVIEAAPERHRPFVFTGRASTASIAYRDLWTEIQTRTHGRSLPASTLRGKKKH
ncbi:MAG: ParA family protein [Acidimicrobiia bacterium]|nr:ParA family protein [Acidimicrobiia bacterium]